MLPLGFTNELGDSSTIILSPHQHHFDPVSSRASHAFSYFQSSRNRPSMPTRPWDPPLNQHMTSPGGIRHAKKRSREDLEIDDCHSHCKLPPAIPKTPFASPDHEMATTAPIGAASQRFQCEVQTSQEQRPFSMNLANIQSDREHAHQKADPDSEPARANLSSKRRRQMESVELESFADGTVPEAHCSREALSHPDEWKVALGVGWETVGGDVITKKGLRGHERFAETHHNFSDVEIVAKNTGLDFCLIRSHEGWYLCSADLQRARRTGSTQEETVISLKQTPLLLETPDVEMILD